MQVKYGIADSTRDGAPCYKQRNIQGTIRSGYKYWDADPIYKQPRYSLYKNISHIEIYRMGVLEHGRLANATCTGLDPIHFKTLCVYQVGGVT